MVLRADPAMRGTLSLGTEVGLRVAPDRAMLFDADDRRIRLPAGVRAPAAPEVPA